MDRAQLTCDCVHSPALPIVYDLRLQAVQLMLPAEISSLFVERAGWRPNGLEGGVHHIFGLWEGDVIIVVFLVV